MENIEKLDKKSMENIQDIYGKISENIGEKNDKLMGGIKALVVSELKEIKNEIGEIKTDMKETGCKVQKLVQNLEAKIEKLKIEKER